MIRSMTGFGQAERSASGWRCVVEMRSVNGRYPDIRMRLPQGLAHLEEPLKQRIKAICDRGKVETSVSLAPEGGGEDALRLNRPLLKSYRALVAELETVLEKPVQVNLGDLVFRGELIQVNSWEDNRESIEALLWDTMEAALADLQSMRETEGAALKAGLLEQVASMRGLIVRMRPLAKNLPDQYAKRLRDNLKRLAGGDVIGEERIIQEITLFADRCDVSEEFARLDTHFDHLENLLDDGGQVGKKLDFLLQELNREANTLGVKCSDAQVSALVIDLKAEIEKMREQVQNIV